MKDYPSIPKVLNEFLNRDCIAFKKYDGTQIRVEWTHKKSWHKFATRGQLFDKSSKHFGCAIDIFNNTHAMSLETIIKNKYPKASEVVAFLEFIGPFSFAGMHEPGILQVSHNEPKELILFDINIHKKGLVNPEEFVKNFFYSSAEVLYQGKLTEEFIKDVREGKYGEGEGVVVKGGCGHKIWQCKIKTWAYLKKIQQFFGTSYGNYWE